jgi:hypothetical protein
VSVRVCDPAATEWTLKIHRAAERARRGEHDLEEVIAAAAAAGCSWTIIGNGLGVWRQSAQRKWAPIVAERNGNGRG